MEERKGKNKLGRRRGAEEPGVGRAGEDGRMGWEGRLGERETRLRETGPLDSHKEGSHLGHFLFS